MYTWGYRWADRHDRPGDREGKVDLSAFYGAFSPACFALLGLWLVAVQIRLPDWEEPLHLLRRKDRAAVLSASLASAASGERLPAEQA